MRDWVIDNLENALATWNSKLAEIWSLLTESPKDFRGGTIWRIITNINGALQAIGLALLVLFFVVGMVKTCSSYTDVKKPEHALKLFVRFVIAKGIVTHGMKLMMAIFNICQGVVSTIMKHASLGNATHTVLPTELTALLQYAGPGWHRQAVRPRGSRDDGTVSLLTA